MSPDEDDLSALLSSAALVFVGQALWSVSKLGERVIIARFLGPSAYGEVSVGLAILSVSTTVAMLGFKQGIPRYMSRVETDRERRGVWVTGLLVTGVTSLLIAGALFLFRGRVVDLLFERSAAGLLLLPFVLTIPFSIGMKVGIGAIRGLENTIYRTYARDLLFPGVKLTLLVALLAAGVGTLAAGVAYLVGTVVACAVAHFLLNRLLPLRGAFETRKREMLAFSLPLLLSTMLSMLLTRTDTLMLGYFRPSYEVGLYSAAYPVAGGMSLVLSSFGFLYLPLASRLDAADRTDEVGSIYALTTKWIFVVTFPVFLTFVVFSGDVLSLIFGREYTDAASALSILVVGFFTSAAAGRNRETLSAFGRTVVLMGVNGLAYLANVALNLALIPAYGFVGAAIASAASYLILNVTVCAVLKRSFGITPFSSASIRTYLVLPGALLPSAFLISPWLSLSAVTLPVFLVVVGLVSVLAVGIAGGLEPEDRLVLELVEGKLGVRVPFVRRYLPESEVNTSA